MWKKRERERLSMEGWGGVGLGWVWFGDDKYYWDTECSKCSVCLRASARASQKK